MKKKKRVGLIILIVVLTLIVVLLVSAVICAALAFTDNNKDKYTLTETDDSLPMTALKNSVIGSEFEASELMINTYLNQNICTSEESDGVLKNIRIYFHKDEDAEIYARIKYMNCWFSLYMKASMTLDTENGIASIKFHDAKLGELPIPDVILNPILENAMKNNTYAQFKDGQLQIQTRFDYNIKSVHFTLNIEKFQIQDGKVLCKTNNLSWELILAIKDFLISEGQDILGSLGSLFS